MYGRSLLLLGFVVSALLVLGAACGSDSSEGEPEPQPPRLVYFIRRLPEPTSNWNAPTAVAVGPNREVWVSDPGLDRIVELNLDGEVVRILCETDECQFTLKTAGGIVYHEGSLYVANSGDGTVVVLSTTGSVERTIEIEDGPQGAAEPADVVVTEDGEIYVSDPANRRVLHLGATGGLIEILLSGDASDSRYRSQEPWALTLDQEENLYVGDAGSGSIRKYSPEGRFLLEFGAFLPDTAPPGDIAVGSDGIIYYADRALGILQAVSPGGNHLGSLGFINPNRLDSPTLVDQPMNLVMSGDLLFVADRVQGVLAFEMDPAYWAMKVEEASQGGGGLSGFGHEDDGQ